MRKTVQALTLILALSAPLTAGEMQCPVISSAPQTTASAVYEPEAGGETTNNPTVDETPASDGLTETVLDLLAGVLALV